MDKKTIDLLQGVRDAMGDGSPMKVTFEFYSRSGSRSRLQFDNLPEALRSYIREGAVEFPLTAISLDRTHELGLVGHGYKEPMWFSSLEIKRYYHAVNRRENPYVEGPLADVVLKLEEEAISAVSRGLAAAGPSSHVACREKRPPILHKGSGLFESEKQFRSTGDTGHANLSAAHREKLDGLLNHLTGESAKQPSVKADTDALDDIVRLMSGEEWDESFLDDIAAIVRSTGRVISDVDEESEEDEESED